MTAGIVQMDGAKQFTGLLKNQVNLISLNAENLGSGINKFCYSPLVSVIIVGHLLVNNSSTLYFLHK